MQDNAIKLHKTEALQWQNEALTVEGQSLFLYLKSAHSSFHSHESVKYKENG